MNLTKLFETQKVLDERIVKEKGLEGRDLLPEKTLALLTELGELSNEWRGFKFWSEDMEPRLEAEVKCFLCDGTGDMNYDAIQDDAEGKGDHEYIDCEECGNTGVSGVRSPLLEEYVDNLHFFLSIGLESNITPMRVEIFPKADSITRQFLGVFAGLGEMYMNLTARNFCQTLEVFIGLGGMLGFTWEQIETAYFEKNKINHSRQENNY